MKEGLFVCLPLRITGTTGSWVRPFRPAAAITRWPARRWGG
jgi:hypothetical protein